MPWPTLTTKTSTISLVQEGFDASVHGCDTMPQLKHIHEIRTEDGIRRQCWAEFRLSQSSGEDLLIYQQTRTRVRIIELKSHQTILRRKSHLDRERAACRCFKGHYGILHVTSILKGPAPESFRFPIRAIRLLSSSGSIEPSKSHHLLSFARGRPRYLPIQSNNLPKGLGMVWACRENVNTPKLPLKPCDSVRAWQ